MHFTIPFLVFCILPITYLIGLLILRNKSTKGFALTIVTLIEAALIISILEFDLRTLERVISIIVNVVFYMIGLRLISKSVLKFGNYQILSFWLIFNKLFKNTALGGKKKMGTVIPFNKATIKYGGRIIDYPEVNGRGGTMVTGAAGSGKTVQALELIKQDMKAGRNIVFFDFKGEPEMAQKIKGFAKEHEYEIYSLDDEDAFSFDPLYEMSPTGRVEAILNTRKWSMDGADAHFRSNTQLLIQKYVTAFDKVFAKSESTMYTANFYNFVMKNKPDLSNRAIADAYKTLQTLLEIILTSKLGPSLKGQHERKFSFSDSETFNEKYIMIISIPSDSKEFANSISSFYFRNIMAIGTRSSYNPALALYVDEFGTLENPFVIKDILEKGRSCGIMTTIIMQDIFQIVINTNEAYLNSLLGTVNNFLIFAGATRDAAVKMAGVQIKEVEGVLQTLMKPIDGNAPTACLISKIPILDHTKSSEVFKYVPYTDGKKPKIGSIFNSGETEAAMAEAVSDPFTSSENDYYSDGMDEDTTDSFDDYMKSNPNVSSKPMTKAEKRKKDDDDFNDFLDDMGIF